MATLVFDLFPVPTVANTLDRVHGVAVMIVFAYGRIIQGASRDATGAGNVTVAVTGSHISENFTACRFRQHIAPLDFTINYAP